VALVLTAHVQHACFGSTYTLSIHTALSTSYHLLHPTNQPTRQKPQWAQQQHSSYPYIAAYDSSAELELLRSEAAAAANECKALEEKEAWSPPPPDEEPETAADYE